MARSCSEAALLPDNPAARSASVGVSSRRSGETSPSSVATSRPWMARAAAPASCWYVTDRTSMAKWLSVAFGKLGGPNSSTSAAST